MTNKSLKQSNDSGFSDEITFKFISDSTLKAFEQDGKKYCRLTASSGGEDLVGDVMSDKALNQMKSSAVGTVMFMNHSTNVPEDVFGTVSEAMLEPKTVRMTDGKEGQLYCLDYLVEVQSDNERAVKTWQMIDKGTKLGASVTVLVKDKSPNPKRNKGIIIEDVEYLETSIVGIPCNRQSWVNSAKKALDLAERRIAKTENINGENEKVMEIEKSTEIETPEVVETETVETTPVEKSTLFARTLAAIAEFKSVSASIEAKTAVELPDVIVKGMFNDILAQEPTLWDLFDILSTVKWRLSSQKANMANLGETDFTAVTNAWDEALMEFHAAAMTSFKYWNDIAEMDEEMVSNSLELEKVLTNFADVYQKTTDENAKSQITESGKKLLELAKQIGIIEADSVQKAQIPTGEQIEQSPVFIELQQKSTELQKQLDEAETNLELAKAGLKVANSLVDAKLRQPLEFTAEGTPATS